MNCTHHLYFPVKTMAKNKRVKGILEYTLLPALMPIALILLFTIAAISITPGESRGEREQAENKESQWD